MIVLPVNWRNYDYKKYNNMTFKSNLACRAAGCGLKIAGTLGGLTVPKTSQISLSKFLEDSKRFTFAQQQQILKQISQAGLYYSSRFQKFEIDILRKLLEVKGNGKYLSFEDILKFYAAMKDSTKPQYDAVINFIGRNFSMSENSISKTYTPMEILSYIQKHSVIKSILVAIESSAPASKKNELLTEAVHLAVKISETSFETDMFTKKVTLQAAQIICDNKDNIISQLVTNTIGEFLSRNMANHKGISTRRKRLLQFLNLLENKEKVNEIINHYNSLPEAQKSKFVENCISNNIFVE